MGTQQAHNSCITFYKMSAQRLRRWSNIVQMLYKCFVFAGYSTTINNTVTYADNHNSCTKNIPLGTRLFTLLLVIWFVQTVINRKLRLWLNYCLDVYDIEPRLCRRLSWELLGGSTSP